MNTMKIFILIALQTLALNAFAESITVNVSNLEGSIAVADDSIQIKSVTIALGVTQHVVFGADEKVKTRAKISEDGKSASFVSAAGSYKKRLYGHVANNRVECQVRVRVTAKVGGKTLKAGKTLASKAVSNLSFCQNPRELTEYAQRALAYPLSLNKGRMGGDPNGEEYLYIE